MFFFHITALSGCVDPSLSSLALNTAVRTDMKAQRYTQLSEPLAETWHVNMPQVVKAKTNLSAEDIA